MSRTNIPPHLQEALSFFSLAPQATPRDFKEAFRRIAKECHPDLFPGDESKNMQFLKLTEYSDIVKAFLELKPDLSVTERGHHFYVEVSMNSLLKGVELLNFDAVCRECGGDGALEDVECPDCKGLGGRLISKGGYSTQSVCPTCSGSGVIITPCPICQSGLRHFRKLVIPEGTKPGHVFCIDGDYVEVVLSRDRKTRHFNIVGNDLVRDVLVPYTHMIFGGVKKVMLPSGDMVRLVIPPHSRCGSVIRVPGYGFRNDNDSGSKPGDFVATLFVEIPTQEMVDNFFIRRHLKSLAKSGM